jgi:hypothetical protein
VIVRLSRSRVGSSSRRFSDSSALHGAAALRAAGCLSKARATATGSGFLPFPWQLIGLAAHVLAAAFFFHLAHQSAQLPVSHRQLLLYAVSTVAVQRLALYGMHRMFRDFASAQEYVASFSALLSILVLESMVMGCWG